MAPKPVTPSSAHNRARTAANLQRKARRASKTLENEEQPPRSKIFKGSLGTKSGDEDLDYEDKADASSSTSASEYEEEEKHHDLDDHDEACGTDTILENEGDEIEAYLDLDDQDEELMVNSLSEGEQLFIAHVVQGKQLQAEELELVREFLQKELSINQCPSTLTEVEMAGYAPFEIMLRKVLTYHSKFRHCTSPQFEQFFTLLARLDLRENYIHTACGSFLPSVLSMLGSSRED